MKFPLHFVRTATVLICLALGFRAFGQNADSKINFNTTYKHLASVGLEFQFVWPVGFFGTRYNGNFSLLDVALQGRFPITSVPVLQPLAKTGIFLVRAENDPTNVKFDHTRFYFTGGLGYLHKFSKSIEAGVEFDAGIGYSVFGNLDRDSNATYGAWNFQASLGGRLVVNPSFNLSLNIHPFIAYSKSFSPLTRFDGFTGGIGVTLDYRFGTDPDNPKAEIKSIQFDEPKVKDMFAAMQSYYINNPVGSVTFTNTESIPLTDLNVTFFQPGYMALGTQLAKIDRLGPGEEVTVPITVSFDKNIFTLEGVTPLTGEIRVDYSLRARKATQAVPVDYDLHDKNSITWDDDRKVAAFITPGDRALANYMSFLRQATKDVSNSGYSEAIQTAMQVYYGLTEIGTLYQRDPTLAYEDAYGNTLVVDTVNLPRDTLIKLAGDCDDLTVLFNGLLESVGLETGFITAPGHIYSMFSTGLPAKDYKLIHPDKNMTVPIGGVLWVPVEITFIGEDDFTAAWQSGAAEFARFVDEEGALGIFFTREAQTVYRPVGFEEKDLGLQYGERTNIAKDFKTDLNSITDLVLKDFEQTAMDDNSKRSWNKLGIVAATLEAHNMAEAAFFSALSLDRNYLSAKVNLANLFYKSGDFQNALRLYHEAENEIKDQSGGQGAPYARLLLNISRTYHEVENFDQAARYSRLLSEVNPILAGEYAYLAEGPGTRRDANISARSRVLPISE